MFMATIAVVVVIAAIFGYWLYQTRRDTSTSADNSSAPKKDSYKAVRVNPHQHACPAAFERHHRVYLVAEAPLLPLMDCTKSEDCRCGYVHYDDRRQSDRRGSSIAIKSKQDIKEKRNKEVRGRRRTDKVD